MIGSGDDISAQTRVEIGNRLDEARRQGAIVLLAVESGSRAWGFPSPDSDFDARFVYARPPADHLVLDPHRDVIEFPVVGDIDVNGWDLRKALLLALKGNAVVVEWAKSPISYEEAPGFHGRLVELLGEIVDPARVARHYLGLARAHVGRAGSFAGDVKLKKLFYLLRPIIMLDWMAQNGFRSLPPMNLVQCLAECDLPQAVLADIEELLRKKARTRELGEGRVPQMLGRFLETRYGHHEMNQPPLLNDGKVEEERRALALAFYRREVSSLG